MKKITALAAVLSASIAYAVPDIPTPENLAIQAVSESEIELMWDNTNPDIAQFDIYRDGVFHMTVPADTDPAQFIDDGLTAGASHSYFLTGCDADRICSDPSNSVSARTFGGVMPGGECELTLVAQNVTITPGDVIGDAVIAWDPLIGMDGFNLYVNNEYIATLNDGTATQWAIDFFDPDSVYTIAAFANNDYFPQSEPATLGTNDPDPDPEPDPMPDPEPDPDLAQALADCNADNADLLADNGLLADELAALQADLTATEDELAACLADDDGALQAALDAANATIAELEAAAVVDAETIAQLQADLQSANDANTTLLTSISDLESAAAVDAQTILDLEADNTMIADENAVLLAENLALTDALALANTDIVALEDEIIALQADIAQLQADLDACQNP